MYMNLEITTANIIALIAIMPTLILAIATYRKWQSKIKISRADYMQKLIQKTMLYYNVWI